MSNTGPPLADVLESVRSGAWGSDVATKERPIPVRVVRNGDISEDRRILVRNMPKRWVSAKELRNSQVTDRDTLVVGSGYIGKSARLGDIQFEEPIIASNFVRIVSPDDKTDPGWLFWLLGLDDATNYMQRVSAGTGLQNLPTSFFKEWKIPNYPSFEQQKYISTILDSVGEAIEQTENVITKTEKLRDALLYKLLTRGIPGHHTEWKEVPGLGTIPATWQVVRLGDVVDINRRSWNPAEGGSILYLDIASVTVPGILALPKEIEAVDAPSRARRSIQLGDILVSTVRPKLRAYARVGQVPNNLVASTGFAVLSPVKSVNGSFIYHHIMKPEFADYLDGATTGQAYPAVRPSDIAMYKLPLPTIIEQDIIAGLLDQWSLTMNLLRQELCLLRGFSSSFATILLTN